MEKFFFGDVVSFIYYNVAVFLNVALSLQAKRIRSEMAAPEEYYQYCGVVDLVAEIS